MHIYTSLTLRVTFNLSLVIISQFNQFVQRQLCRSNYWHISIQHYFVSMIVCDGFSFLPQRKNIKKVPAMPNFYYFPEKLSKQCYTKEFYFRDKSFLKFVVRRKKWKPQKPSVLDERHIFTSYNLSVLDFFSDIGIFSYFWNATFEWDFSILNFQKKVSHQTIFAQKKFIAKNTFQLKYIFKEFL